MSITSEFCFFISSDDYLDYSHIDKAISELSSRPSFAAYFTTAYVLESNSQSSIRINPQIIIARFFRFIFGSSSTLRFPKLSLLFPLYLFLTQLPPGGNFILYRTLPYLSISPLFPYSSSLIDLHINLSLTAKYGAILELKPHAVFSIVPTSYSSRHRSRSPLSFLESSFYINENSFNRIASPLSRLLWTAIITTPWLLQDPSRFYCLLSNRSSLFSYISHPILLWLLFFYYLTLSPLVISFKILSFLLPPINSVPFHSKE